MDAWWIAYGVVAGVALVQALLVALQTWEHCRYARRSMRRLDRYQPLGRAMVVAPCKGFDVDLAGNLAGLLRQDYADYEVAFVVESADDPACPLIRRAMADNPQTTARLVIAGVATESGQKVHNLRAATAAIPPGIEYLAFVDSDARPRPEWLRLLVARLARDDLGAATGYRWYLPERPSAANHLLYSINCGIMGLLSRDRHNLVWGGSWAIGRERFESLGIHAAWRGTLSDDLVASRVLRAARLPIRFEPAAVVGSPLDQTRREMFAFVRRQYMVGRFYTPGWWAFACLASLAANGAWLLSLGMIAWGLVYDARTAAVAGGVLAALYGLGVIRGWLRQGLVKTYFPEHAQDLRRAARFDIWAAPLVGLVNGLGLAASMVGRHITWRGICYRVYRGGQIRIVSGTLHVPPARPLAA